MLLRLLDRYRMNVQVKNTPEGAFWNPEIIIITCPRTPKEEFVYRDKWDGGNAKEYEDIEQLLRRIHVIKNYENINFATVNYIKGSNEYFQLME